MNGRRVAASGGNGFSLARMGHAMTANARRTMQENPDYFAVWYTVKSIGLVVAIAVAAYFAGRARGRT